MIVATAGHVDHGKTSLVKNLSGVDTDNLDEEKRRGLSINLGYAYLQADADTTIGFIDVPGHSRFINTMIAGVSSIDLALIIVAADEGLMPQTIEHIEVLSLLNISQYVVVISHIDRVEAVRAKEVVKSVQEKLGLRCPVFEVNNLNGAGIDNLKKYLVDTAEG
jgi:selenocysteine-specific elongation factor